MDVLALLRLLLPLIASPLRLDRALTRPPPCLCRCLCRPQEEEEEEEEEEPPKEEPKGKKAAAAKKRTPKSKD